MTHTEAFSLGRYPQDLDHRAEVIAHDLARLVRESAVELPLNERVNHFELKLVMDSSGKSKIINTGMSDADVETCYSDVTELERREREAGLKMRACLLHQPEQTLAVWISPMGGPGRYEENRMVVGYVTRNDRGEKIMRGYGICTAYVEADSLLQAQTLAKHADNRPCFKTSEDLRSEITVFTHLGDPWNFLNSFIALDDVWRDIASGEVEQRFAKTLRDSQAAVNKVMPLLDRARTNMDRVYAGAQMEMYMMELGWMMANGLCGLLNSQILFESRNAFYAGLVGETTMGKKSKYVEKCGQCPRLIQKVISEGYVCPGCHGVYQGC